MPLRDHFRSPFIDVATWEEVHGQWPALIVQQLNTKLPEGFSCGPRVPLGARVEVDVAAFEYNPTSIENAADYPAATSARWAPAAPTLAVETDLSDFDEYEVRIYDNRRRRELVAAIELISPANKDRPEARSQFVAKCAALLRQGVSLILIDVVTSRHFNLYAELLQLIDRRDPTLGDDPPPTYAVSSRWVPFGVGQRLEAWNNLLVPDNPLPTVPLWLPEDKVLPLDLEDSYEKTLRDLRIA